MATVLSGLVGGLLGAIVTAAVMRAAGDEPGPSASVWAMYLGDGNPAHYVVEGMATHAVYGAVAGAVFALFAGGLALGLSTVGGALVGAVVWSAVLAVVAVGFWSMVVIGETPDARSLLELGAVHLVFGIVLGLWVYYVPSL